MSLLPFVGPACLGDSGAKFQGRLGGLGQQGGNGRKGLLPRPLSTQQLLNGLKRLFRRVGVKN